VAVVTQRGPVGAELLTKQALHLVGRDAVGGFQIAGRNDDRRPADGPVAARAELGELGQGLQAVPGPSLGRLLRAVLPTCLAALTPFLVFAGAAARSTRATSSSARRAYQTSIVAMVAKPAIASRYAVPDARVAARVSALPARSAAITLAAPR